MKDSYSTHHKVRKVWVIWWLLPFPLANALVLPAGLLFAFYAILPAFFAVHFSPGSIRKFPSPEQINAYGMEFYKTLLSRSMLAVVISAGCWLGIIIVLSRALGSLRAERQHVRKATLLQYSLSLTALSILSAVLLILAIGMIG